MSITIFTPTYNRAHTISRAYESLCKQEDKDFTWLIVDDGSSDETKKLVHDFIEEEKVKIQYRYKENGGKHTAWNVAMDTINTEWVIILDSDDELTTDAISIVKHYVNKYKDIKNLSGIYFLKKYPSGELMSEPFKIFDEVTTGLDCIIRSKHKGDYCLTFNTDIFNKYPFKCFENEKYIGETTILSKMGLECKSVYINETIYVADYHEDGLTKQGRSLRINNPFGGMEYASVHLDKRMPLSIRVKSAILYGTYALFTKEKSKNVTKGFRNYPLTIPYFFISFPLYMYWKKRFQNQN